jgi:hypothetical protein
MDQQKAKVSNGELSALAMAGGHEKQLPGKP